MVGVVKSCSESNPIPSRDAQRAQTNRVSARTQRTHRDWDRPCLSHTLGDPGQQWPAMGEGALGAADLCMA